MKKFSVVALAMTATLALAACSLEDEPEEATTAEESADESADTGADEGADESAETGDSGEESGDAAEETGDAADQTEAAGGEYSEPACNEFFTEGGPLADRADAARSALDAGEVTDQVAYSEIMLLKSRLDATAEEAPQEISDLLSTVNAPFTEAVDLVNEGSEDVVGEEGEITLPEIDTQASADAQAELETVCAG